MKHDCWICLDAGVVELDKKVKDMIYKGTYRCNCLKGETYSSFRNVAEVCDTQILAFNNKTEFENLKVNVSEVVKDIKKNLAAMDKKTEILDDCPF